eukprot:scpid49283/ scgid1522/ 
MMTKIQRRGLRLFGDGAYLPTLAWTSAEWSEHSAFCTSSTFQLAQTCFSPFFHPERPTHHAIADAHKSIPHTSFSSLPLFRPEHGMMSFGPSLTLLWRSGTSSRSAFC